MNHDTATAEPRRGKVAGGAEAGDFVSVVIGGQLFGIPVL
jgi:hypothetical protein